MPEQETEKQSKWGKLKGKAGDASSEFLFWMIYESSKPKIVATLRKWLQPFTPQAVREMVLAGTFPNVEPEILLGAQGFDGYLAKIKADELIDFLAEARPDLMQAIAECGNEKGGAWIMALREHLLHVIAEPEAQLGESRELPPQQPMKQAKCTNCGKTWPVLESEFSKIEACPFCLEKAR